MKVVSICSGGLDSTVLYYYLLSRGDSVIALNFSYGSKHNEQERKSAKELIPGIKCFDIDLSFLNSSLLASSDSSIPHGNYNEENMKSTVVPFRNGILLSYAVAYAESIGYEAVALGSHSGDHTIYPDCRPLFTTRMSEAASEGTFNRIQVVSPFNNISKGEIVKIGHSLGIDTIMSKTWTCYEGKSIHCGLCGACRERKEAFLFAHVKDQTKYEN